MTDKRLIDANALLREMRFGARPAYLLMMDAPTIDPKSSSGSHDFEEGEWQ